MADEKLTQKTELVTPVSTDYLYAVDDPAGSALTQYVQWANIHKGMTQATSAEITTGSVVEPVFADGLKGSAYGTFRKTGTIISPGDVYDVDTEVPIFRTDAAITITRIHISGPDSTPTTELDIDLKWADDLTAYTNAAVIDVCDTTSGVVTITTGFDDATVASGKYVYWSLGADPHADWTYMYFEIYYTYD